MRRRTGSVLIVMLCASSFPDPPRRWSAFGAVESNLLPGTVDPYFESVLARFAIRETTRLQEQSHGLPEGVRCRVS